jgi:UDP-N-acetylglucosamine--N-acetylmuramyl-(pentapeptide) pyrophosphoryl-undecaprenol N-acetylglucosamine transferase
VFPGIATARALKGRGHEVTVWLSGKAIETATRQAWDGPVVDSGAEGISASPAKLPLSLIRLARVLLASRRALRASRPDALLAMGSYSSVGPVLAAQTLGIPVVLHEANVIPGRAVAHLARFAKAIGISFPETRRYLRHPSLTLTGVPLRRDLETRAAWAAARTPGAAFTVLTMGGSQGAQRLNQAVPEALGQLRREGLQVEAIHLAGERDRAAVETAYAAAGVPAEVQGFCHDMAAVYGRADLAIARSGANSCMELALFAIPSILVPYPHSARDHQLANARAMETAGAARVIEQKDLETGTLAAPVRDIATQPAYHGTLREAARRRAIRGADERLADLLEACASS